MSSAQAQIAVASNVHNLASSHIQKDYLEDSLNRQNSLNNNRVKSNMKGKHLTRSHAMRESTSPPRTPTPRIDQQLTSTGCGLVSSSSSSSSSSSTSSNHSPSQETNDCKMHVQSSLLSPSPLLETPSVIVTSQHSQQQQQQNVICNEADFPKLSPPKSSKSPRNSQSNNFNSNSGNSNNNNNNNSSSINHNNNSHNNRDLIEKFNNSHQQCDTTSTSGNEHNNKIEYGNVSNNKKVVLEVNKTVDGGAGGNGTNSCIASISPTTVNIINHTENNSNGSHYMGPDAHVLNQENTMSMYDKENRCPRNDSQNSNNSLSPDENQNSLTDSPSDISKHERMGKKHRTNSNSKSSKPRLKNMGSSSSMDGGNSNSTSGFISRDSSTEQFTDQSGVDLLLFFKETLNKNPKDRNTLMKIEKDLVELAQDKTRTEMRFPAMSSYNRMLIHRTAAFFGMEHNVDAANQQCVIVATTKGTRLPDIRFKSLFRERMSDDQPRKSILKRDTHSFDDARQSYLCPDRGTLDRKAKSFEEREEEYEKVRRRIFRNRESGEMMEDPCWTYLDNADQVTRMRQSNKMLKVQSSSNDSRNDGRQNVSKSHSFGGYGGLPPSNCGNGGVPLLRGDSTNSTKSAGPRLFSKQDSIGSTSTPWRLSPSSSGYKTQTQSLRSDSVTPSPTGYGSDEHTPEPSVVHSPPPAPCGLVWAVTDIASVPRGSVLINPHTLQPIVNQDGSIYHFDPSNLPPSQAMASGMYSKSPLSSNIKKKQEKHKLCSKMDHSVGNDIMSSSSSCGDAGNTNTAESSTETVSESSTQTVIVTGGRDDDKDSKDSITKREMDDIQEVETIGSSGEDCEKSMGTEKTFDRIEVQKFKNQATSPNIPTSDSEGPLQPSEIIAKNDPKSDVNAKPSSHPLQAETTNSSSSTPASTSDSKKDEPKSWTYTHSYQAIDGSTVFQTTNGNPYSTTTYQQGPDGSVYAVPQGMVYAYPPPMDGEMQGYFMPMFDPSQQRDPNGLIPSGTQAIYQPAGGAAMVPVAAYPTTQFAGAPIYQGQVVYSSDQFPPGGAAVAAASGQMQQYPMTTYPIGYPYPYNGYWGQTMTYYVPQQSLANAVPSSILPPPTAPLQPPSSNIGTTVSQINTNSHTNAPGNNNSHTISGMGGGRGKRATPPHHQQNNVQSNNYSVTSANTTYQLGPGVPLALASDLNGPTMYAIPQHAVFSSNILPYAHQSTTTPANAAAAAGVLAPLPHQPNAVISSLFNHPPLTTSNGQVPLEPPPPTGYTTHGTNGNSNHVPPTSGTPQSAPSTPHALSHHNQRNLPLFATPPIISSNFNSPIQAHYQSFSDVHNTSGGGTSHSYEKRNGNGAGGGGGINRNKSINGINGGHPHARQNSSSTSLYGTPNGGINNKPLSSSADLSNQSSVLSSNGPQGQRPMHMSQAKRINGGDKPMNSSMNGSHMGMNGGRADTNNNNSNQSAQNGPENNKPRISSGYRQKPSNLELRRSVSQRNSPSANSNESNNNSPNSIVSSYASGGGIPSYVAAAADNQQSSPVYITRGTHIPPMHAAAQNAQAAAVVAAAAAANEVTAGCPQPLIGAYNHPGAPTSVYIKYGQTYFAHPTVTLQNNRRSPPSDLRPQMAPITGMYPAMNMMISAPRQVQPRHPNPNYKGTRPSR